MIVAQVIWELNSAGPVMKRDLNIRHIPKNRRRRHLRRALLVAMIGTTSSVAHAQMPTGADVVAGQAAISQAGNTLNVDAATSRAIVNWESFNVGAANVANFNLPDANSAILNRVTSANMPSTIAGAVNSNGHVYLVNPSGIVVSSSGMVNTNGFTASTFDVANQDFMDGGALAFADNGSTGSIVNNGTIATGDGGAHLIANDIANNGSITSTGGNITLSGGGSVTLENGVTYIQPTMETLASGISPTAGLIQNTGTIRATGAATSGGEVYLVNPNGNILHDGTISVGAQALADQAQSQAADPVQSNAEAAKAWTPTTGGKVQLEADSITLAAGSTIDASGTHGGGEVLVGGDWQGSGDMTQATTVMMEAGATIDASATESGDGGNIVLWSDITNANSVTKAFGTLIARAGELLGDGGQIETSGATVETDGIAVNAGAANGNGGLWLIDPYDYTVDASAATSIVNTLNTGTSVEVSTTANNASFGSSGNNTDNGDITVEADIVTGAMAGDATLTLKAARHIIVNAASGINATQNGNTAKLNVKLWADTDNSGDGISIVSSPTIATNGGSLTFGNGDTATIGGVTTKVGGDLYVNGVTAQVFDTAGGDITVNGETILANTNGVTFDSGGGDILFAGVLNSGNQYTYVDGPDGQANSWDWARNDAKNGTAGGAALGDSYMVTITSRLENAIAGIAAGYRGAWIGAYRDTSTPNNWLWADGPEAVQHFFTQAGSGGSALSGSYSNFGANEPNGSGTGGETRGQFFGTAGQWNDLGPSTTFSASQDSVYSVLGYVRETNLAPTALTVDAGAGSVTINGGVGGSKALSSLDITSSAIAINGNSLITTGAQNYSSALDVTSTLGLTVDGSTLTTGGALDFAATGDIDIDASIVAPGAISIAGKNITLVEDIDNSSASGADILLKASDTLIVGASGVDLEAGTGDVTLRANTFSWGGFNPTINTSGTLAILPSTDSSSFTHTAVKTSWFNLNGILGGLQIGHAANTSGITVNSAESVAGPISLYGNDITIEADLNTSGVSGSDILLKASGDVIVSANSNLITNTGDVTLWSDSDTNNDGYVSLDSDSSIVTGGGNIVIGGGADSGSDGIPDGAATGQALLSDGGTFYSGISLYKSTLDTRSGGTLDANAGNITLNGTSTYTGGDRAVGVLLHSTKLVGDVVDVTGSVTHTGGTTTRYGVSSNGGLTPDNTNIQAYGGITLTGNAATPATQYSIRWGTNHEMSVVDGDIAINSNGQLQYLSSQTLILADMRSLIFNSDYDAEWRNIIAGDGGLIKQGTGTLELTRQNTYVGATTISDGHLIIRNDAPSIATSQFNGTGRLTVESDASSFSSPLAFGASINGLSEVIIGKSTNTANITFAEDISVNGPITVYGGTLDFAGSVAAGSNNINLVGNDLQLADTVSSTGALTIETQTSGTSIGVGNISGTLAIDNAELANLQNGFSSITIGNSTAGDLVVGGITALVDDLTLQAGTSSDLFVNDSLSWSSDDALTLAAGQDIFVNSHINVTGSAAALNLYYGGTDGSSAPTSSTNYYIDVANRRHIRFDEVTAGLKIGNESFTLLDSVSALQGMAVSGRYALAGDLSLAGTTYTDAFYTSNFAGKLDGLGNEVDGLTARASAGGNFGLFGQLNGGTVRHLGVTNIDILGQSTSNAAANDLRVGGIVGNASGSGTNLLDGVWSTGVIATKQGSQQDVFYAGGLVGGHDSGTLNILRSFSTVNVSSQGSHSGKMALGGLLGDTGDYNGISSIGGAAQTLLIDRSYATGSIVEGTYDGYYGSGGLVGVIYGDTATLTDSFSRSNVVGGISSGGIAGYSLPGTTKTYQRLYTTLDRFGNGTSPTQSYKSDTLDAATSNGTVLPSGWSSDVWTAGEFPTLKAVGVPASLLYVKVINGMGIFGDLAAPTYQIVDADGNTVSFGTGDYSNLDGVTGTGRYTLGQFTNVGTYNSVSYLSGLGLTGDDANLYALNPFSTAGSFTITPRSITAILSNTGVTKVYDGNANAPSGFTPTYTFGNLASGDSATINYTSLLYNSQDVTAADTLTMSGMTLAGITGSNGSLLSDYALTTTTSSLAATITAKPIFIGNISASNKIYDGNTSVTLDTSSATFTGVVSGDNLTFGSVSGAFADKNVGNGKTVSLTGVLGGTDASNYSSSGNSTTTANITPKSLTVAGITAGSRIYDGSTAATVDLSGVSFTGIVSGDTVTAADTTGAFADKNVGNGKTVTLSGTTYGGTDVGNYSVTNQASTTANITPKSVSVSGLDANNRIYDGTSTTTVDHSGVSFAGIVSGDSLTASSTTGTFGNKNVGSSKAVTLSGTTYGGTDAGNYAFTNQTSSTANITQKAITVSGITAGDKVYDGTTTSTVDLSGVTFNGKVSGDTLTAAGTSGTFADKKVADDKTVTFSGTTYGGTDFGNYNITDQSSTTADITAKSITVSGLVANDRVYDGTTAATVDHSGVTFGGMVAGDNLTAASTTGAFANKNVADDKAVTLSGTTYGGTDVGNYTFTDQTANTADITPKSITVSGLVANDLVYDGTTNATVDHSGVTFGGMVSGDNLAASATTGQFANKNVADDKAVTLSGTTYGGTDVNNYSFTGQTSSTADITPKTISVSGLAANDRIYDGTTAATVDHSGVTFDGMISGDNLTAANTTGAFANKNVADDKAVALSGTTYGGTDVNNYTITNQTSSTADITPKSITVSGLVANDRIYDGTTNATVDHSGVTFGGMITGDSLTVASTTGQFANKSVADDKAVALSGSTYGGADANNYTFTEQTSSIADITPKSITVSGITAANKIYDGTTTSTVDISGVTFNGIVSGDALTAANTTGTFDSKNVASGKTVTLNGTTYGGADVNNYAITDQASTTADVTPKSVTISGLVADDRIYDGTTDATVDHSGVTFNGMIAGDNLTAASTTGQFANGNVADDKAVTLSGTTYGGTDVNNYTFTNQASSTADITPKSISVSGLVAQDRVYDTTTDATIDHSGVTFNGVVAGDSLTASGTTGLFADKHVDTTKAVTLSGTTYGGTDVGNYVIADQTASTADITPFSVVIAGVAADDKVYDSNTSATLSGTATANTFAGDDVAIDTNYIASFAGANVGDDQSVTVSGFALSGTDATNYTLAQSTGLTADITPAPLTITANNDSKFVTKLDVTGYAGTTFDGFVGSEGVSDLAGSLNITRLGTDEAAGTFTSVLDASGLTSANYDITFVRGDYTIIPAEQFLIRFGNSDSTYGDAVGFSFLSAEYMDAGFNVATLSPTVNGNEYSFNDGVGGTAQFTIGLDGASLSTSGHANAGTYELTMSDLIASGGNFSNDINLFGTHTINRANLTVGAGGVSKAYDGSVLMNNLTLDLTGLVAGDTVNINGQGSYADRHAGTGLSYTVANLTLSGDDANNYILPGGSVLSDTNGVITAKAVTINAPTVTKVYDGNTNFGATATQLTDWTTSLGIAGDTVDGITLTFDDKNVGTGKTLTPSSILINDGNGGANYDVAFNTDTASGITRLSSVTWIGGATGDWNDPTNWAGGAVPDLANVASVIIPAGVTPTFGTNVAGPVELDSFSGGSLQLDGGTLDVFGLFDADTLTQNGGALKAGDLNVADLTQNGGNVQVDNDFTVTNTFTQSTSGTINFGGTADITHTGGTLIVNDLSSGNIKLDSTTGGVHLNNLQSTGTLTIDATGDVTQDNTGTLSVAGTTSITTDADINLGGPNNDFVGPVSLDADNATINDSTGGLVLGGVATTGSLDASTTSGNITQSSTSQITIGTTTSLTADGDINLTGESNQFSAPVNLNSDNAEVTQAIGDLVLGTVNIVDQFWTDVLAGNLNQTSTSTITVGGTSTLNARGPISLTGTGNDFHGSVTVNAPLFNVQSATPPTIIRTGAALADEVGLAANSETVNDTIIRPAAPLNANTSMLTRVIEFIANLVSNASVTTPTNALNTVDIQQSGNDTFIRPKQNK